MSIEQASAYQAMTGVRLLWLVGASKTRSNSGSLANLVFHTRGLPDLIETVTTNLSSDGFYFLSQNAVQLRGVRTCTLGVPTNHPWSAERVLLVECKVRKSFVSSHTRWGVWCRVPNSGLSVLDRAGHGFPDPISVSANGRF